MLLMEKDPSSLESEAFRALRTNVEYSPIGGESKVIVITSAQAQEGKTSVSVNLASSLTQINNKVVLVDCDMRRPSIHKKFSIANEDGLAEILIKKKQLKDVVRNHNDKLSIITAGNKSPNPAEILADPQMEKLIEDMKREYDYIILDTPPIGTFADAQILAGKVDGVLLVVRANKTKRNLVLSAVNAVKKVNGKVIGTVINGVDRKINRYYYK